MSIVAKPEFDPIRLRFNLDKRDLDDGFAVLGFGPYDSGKTHLMGDFLATQSKDGEIAYLDVLGERGSLSVANFELGNFGYKVNTYTDLINLISYFKGRNLAGVGLDSLQTWLPLVCKHLFKEDRMPEEPAEWNRMHFTMKQSIDALKASCKWIFCTCSASIEVDPEEKVKTGATKPFIAPDLPGKQARVVIGNFDLAGYLEKTKVGTKVTRKFVVESSGKLLVRQRLPNSISKDIIIPHNHGGWAAIRAEIEIALTTKPEGVVRVMTPLPSKPDKTPEVGLPRRIVPKKGGKA